MNCFVGAWVGSRWRLKRRTDHSPVRGMGFRLLAILVALLIGGLVAQLSGLSITDMIARVFASTFGRAYGREQLGIFATPVILAGAAFLVADRMRLFNVGAEGQILMGAWAGTAIGLHVDGPGSVVLAMCFIAGAAGGAMWALLPAVLRLKAGISEVLTTLLMNFIAAHWVYYWSLGPWWDAAQYDLAATHVVRYELPGLVGHLHSGILIAVMVVVALHFALRNTTWGYEITTIGGNERAGRYAGMRIERQVLVVMLLSGAIAGVAGVIEVTGVIHRLSGAVSQGYGFLGIIAAVLAGGQVLLLVPAGALLAIILNSTIALRTQGVSFNIVLAFIGLILFLAALGDSIANYRLERVPPQQRTGEAPSTLPDHGDGSSKGSE